MSSVGMYPCLQTAIRWPLVHTEKPVRLLEWAEIRLATVRRGQVLYTFMFETAILIAAGIHQSVQHSAAIGVGGNQNDNSAASAGAVYVFVRTGVNWSQQAYIKASNTDGGDLFGESVALSTDGNTLAVGASYESSGATGVNGSRVNGSQNDNNASGSGAVYIFVRTSATWVQQAYIKASNTDADDHFGQSVALSSSGNTLAVGSSYESSAAMGVEGDQSNNGLSDAGAVYLFARVNEMTWSQTAYLKASNTGLEDRFGRSVSLSATGDKLDVGAMYEASAATGVGGDENDNSASRAGAAYLFIKTNTAWSQQAYLKASNTGAQDQFGRSLALSANGDTLAVGILYEDSASAGIDGAQNDNSAKDAGAAVVFQ